MSSLGSEKYQFQGHNFVHEQININRNIDMNNTNFLVNFQGWNFLSDVFSASSGFKSTASSRGGSNPTSRKTSNAGLRVTGLGSRRASGSVLSGYGYDLEVASARSR